ncbi:hypothetical protein AF335_17480 [Streptomyces eurocidicus]|uniref:Uncharacterized protein n=1 Tax=Streptomyces eurocidicus TaxID=66423 RepID=A0A2N8NUF8_STREU|nr:hypothetical protein [Streptomyces eurocidicus]PNE32401.1 hypothetical protein AF335_17480 [Streptomyces eurocidicus]
MRFLTDIVLAGRATAQQFVLSSWFTKKLINVSEPCVVGKRTRLVVDAVDMDLWRRDRAGTPAWPGRPRVLGSYGPRRPR